MRPTTLRSLRTLLAAVALAASGLACKTPSTAWPDTQASQPEPRYAGLQSYLRGLVAEKRVAGVVALVAREGQVELFEAYGQRNAEAGLPMTRDTLFRICSMSKPLTSVGVMMLVEEGRLALTDPVSKYIPAFKHLQVAEPVPGTEPVQYRRVPLEREVTLYDLLTHQSGLGYGFLSPSYFAQRYLEEGVSDGLAETPGTLGDNVQRLARVPLLHQPGQGWTYGLSTDVLGHVIEVVAGQSLSDFMEARLFQPLKMKDTGFHVLPEDEPRLSAVYQPREDQTVEPLPPGRTQKGTLFYSASYPLDRGSRFFSGGAGLVSTAGDYLRFAQMLLNGGELEGVRLLKPETVELMTRNHVGGPIALRIVGSGFGLGFAVVSPEDEQQGLGSVGSYGWGGFYNTHFWVDPQKKLTGIVMTQLQPWDSLGLHLDFRKHTYAAQGR